MKFNLKNFPKVKQTFYPHEKGHKEIVAMLLWKRDFEAELRETLELMQKKRPHWPCMYIVKEILGE